MTVWGNKEQTDVPEVTLPQSREEYKTETKIQVSLGVASIFIRRQSLQDRKESVWDGGRGWSSVAETTSNAGEIE